MNIVQIAERLRGLPISVLPSEDIITILNQVNGAVPDEQHITASSTGNDVYKLFNESVAEVQTELLKDIFTARRATLILGLILEESGKRNLKDNVTGRKWGSFQGSILLIAAGVLLSIIWSFFSNHSLKPPVPDAVVGNLITDLIQIGSDLLIDHVQNGSKDPVE